MQLQHRPISKLGLYKTIAVVAAVTLLPGVLYSQNSPKGVDNGLLDAVYVEAREGLATYKEMIQRYGSELAEADGFDSVEQVLRADIGSPYPMCKIRYDELREAGVGAAQLFAFRVPMFADDSLRRVMEVYVSEGRVADGAGYRPPSPIDSLLPEFVSNPEYSGAEVYGVLLDYRYHFIVIKSTGTVHLVAPDEASAEQLSMSVGVPESVESLQPRMHDYIQKRERLDAKAREYREGLRELNDD